jgi:tRNA(adenine34) deaminase
MELYTDEYFMREALKEAIKAFEEDEVPVGAVLVGDKRILVRGHNLTERLIDVTAHAEMQVLTGGSHALGAKYLPDCTLYVTLEPCVMCSGALFWSQIGRVVFGAYDQKRGYQSWRGLTLHPRTEVLGGLFAEESTQLLQRFFQEKRNK